MAIQSVNSALSVHQRLVDCIQNHTDGLEQAVSQAHELGLLNQHWDNGLANETYLCLAIRIGHLAAVKELIKYPVDINLPSTYPGTLPQWPSRLYFTSVTPLQISVFFGLTQIAAVLISKKPTLKIPKSSLTCKELALEKFIEHKDIRWMYLLILLSKSAAEKKVDKLSIYNSNIDRPKLISLFEHITCIVLKSKLLNISPDLPKQTLYDTSSQAIGVLIKDSAEDGPIPRSSWEPFIYRMAILLGIENNFLTTKGITLDFTLNKEFISAVIKDHVDSCHFIPIDIDWKTEIPFLQFVKAIVIQMYFNLNCSNSLMLRQHCQTKELVLLDFEKTLDLQTEGLNQDLNPGFNPCLLRLQQAFIPLKSEEIQLLEEFLDYLSSIHPKIELYFTHYYMSVAAKNQSFYRNTSIDHLTHMQTILKQWKHRLKRMQKALIKQKGERSLHLFDFVCDCYPAFKTSCYLSLAQQIIESNLRNTTFSLEQAIKNFFSLSNRRQNFENEYTRLGIPPRTFRQIKNRLFHLNLKDFLQACEHVTFTPFTLDEITLKKEYEKEADILIAEIRNKNNLNCK